MTFVRRLRGALLRLAFNRRKAFVSGLLCVGVSGWLMATEAAWESWVSDGIGLIAGSTGVALVIFALSGRRPDWEE